MRIPRSKNIQPNPSKSSRVVWAIGFLAIFGCLFLQSAGATPDASLFYTLPDTGAGTATEYRFSDDSLRLDTLRVGGADPVSFTYDDDSLLLSAGALSIVLEPDTGRLATVTLDQITTEWTYTPFGEPETVTTRHGAAVIFEESFSYDKRGWITDLGRTQSGSTTLETFDYDGRGRLEAVEQDGTPRASYSYDSNSNRTSYTGPFPDVATTTYDARDRLTHYGDTTYAYTEAGELVSKSATKCVAWHPK